MISGVRSDSQAGYLSPRSAASVTRLDMAHSKSAGGNVTATSTRASPASAMSDSAPAITRAAHLGMDHRHTEVDGDHGPLAAQLLAVAPEPGLPSLDTGKAVGVMGVVAVADVVPASRVAHRPADAPDGDGVGDLVDEGPFGDPPVVRLQPEHAREARPGSGWTRRRPHPTRWGAGRPPPRRRFLPTTRPGCARGSRGCASRRAAAWR